MALPQRARGVKVLKAVSSSLRLQILNLLFDKGSLSYTELMNSLKMNPSRDAGRFAYHLKFLLKADLVEADAETRKYCPTDLGKMVIDVADRVEKKAVKPRGMLVRTSHFTLEEFDANKIANSLMREAKIPAELAQKSAKEAEKRLLKSKTKYVTAPLIREVVNALLIEKGMEDYRHKLTRLGLPVHEVTSLIEAKDSAQNSVSIISTAGKTVFREYTLLNVFPRDVADAHASGALHINGLSTWILKPNEIMHDLRFFFQNGLRLDTLSPLQLSQRPPQSFESALSMALNVLLQARTEISELQTLDFFNVFLAPFARGLDSERIKQNLHLFILNLNQHADVTLGLEVATPKFMADKTAVGPQGKMGGKYADFAEESLLIASLVIEIFAEESSPKPLLNPRLIIKINDEALMDENAKAVLLKAHKLAAEKGTPYFANMLHKAGRYAVFSASGCKLEADLTEDWETDTLRTGCLGFVTINLPRIVHESERDRNKFAGIVRERCELAARALEIRFRALRQFGKNSLPFMMQSTNGDTYFRLENCSSILNLAGFREAVESFCEKPFGHEESMKFAAEVIQNIQSYKHKIGRKHGRRVFPAILPSAEASERLAQLDIEKYGIAKVKHSGTREKPFYSTTKRLPLQVGNPLPVPPAALEIEQKLKDLNWGGSLSVIELEGAETKPEDLMKLTMDLFEKQTVEFFTYNRKITYCSNCKKSWLGILHRCPSCGSISTMITFDRFTST
jgi:anaerobic ribonucleoside-triphosphate reductase